MHIGESPTYIQHGCQIFDGSNLCGQFKVAVHKSTGKINDLYSNTLKCTVFGLFKYVRVEISAWAMWQWRSTQNALVVKASLADTLTKTFTANVFCMSKCPNATNSAHKPLVVVFSK